MRLGIIQLLNSYGYVVDLDDEEMVEDAKECLYEDMYGGSSLREEFESMIKCTELSAITKENIPEFLREEEG